MILSKKSRLLQLQIGHHATTNVMYKDIQVVVSSCLSTISRFFLATIHLFLFCSYNTFFVYPYNLYCCFKICTFIPIILCAWTQYKRPNIEILKNHLYLLIVIFCTFFLADGAQIEPFYVLCLLSCVNKARFKFKREPEYNISFKDVSITTHLLLHV